MNLQAFNRREVETGSRADHTFTLEYPTLEDIELLDVYLHLASRETVVAGGPLTPQESRSIVRSRVSRKNNHSTCKPSVFLLCSDGRPVGYTTTMWHDGKNSTNVELSIFLSPYWRGRRWSAHFMSLISLHVQSCIKHADDRRQVVLSAHSALDNDASNALLRRVGFREIDMPVGRNAREHAGSPAQPSRAWTLDIQ